ncbi:MAG: methylenetetrahydrofolate--tRNA-(uracil(54)-C(5))-methyltransferase (FADH(2)-oxidizing) TrmFO [Raoultibacter sp.]|jgi:methylenetetrahydrofolate--tRNA-(uracil-5-)-methyltransferase
MSLTVNILGAGLAGSEAAIQLADRGVMVRLFEMRPKLSTPVHTSSNCAELVCSNSLKSTKAESAAGMLKYELKSFGSHLLHQAFEHQVAAGGALAVHRENFSSAVTRKIEEHPCITLIREEANDLPLDADATIVCSGPLTSDALAQSLQKITGSEHLAFYDAAAPIVMADSLDHERLFRQSRYETDSAGDYLNAGFNKEEYISFIEELKSAKRVIEKDFETSDLFQACQPIEEIARKNVDAPRFGAMKPVGLTDPKTGRRPWAALQLRAEDMHGLSYNLVGFQTNLTFPEQERVFRMIPGLEKAEFSRFGVMHRNTFIDAPRLLTSSLQLRQGYLAQDAPPVFIAGQLAGTEGYCEAIMSGLWAALNCYALLHERNIQPCPSYSAFGALMAYATNPETRDYQPMHVNFGIMEPLEPAIKKKKERYSAYAKRGSEAVQTFCAELEDMGILKQGLHS